MMSAFQINDTRTGEKIAYVDGYDEIDAVEGWIAEGSENAQRALVNHPREFMVGVYLGY